MWTQFHDLLIILVYLELRTTQMFLSTNKRMLHEDDNVDDDD